MKNDKKEEKDNLKNENDTNSKELEKDKKENHNSEDNDDAKENLKEIISNLKLENAELKLENISYAAEIENIKKRNLREKSDFVKYSNQKLITQIIPLIDNYELALKASEVVEDKNVKKFLSGISMAIDNFKNCLKKEGVETYQIELKKDLWDGNFCEVIDEVENDDLEDGTVVEVLKNGYLLNGRMIRPASVIISKKSQKTE